ncbi:MAG: hypothetical protein DCC68_06415 [Planctomycetota bacterium]|nr:MAG: hypothetical protein DCC68_06415 [Planctomycetota bacterium]
MRVPHRDWNILLDHDRTYTLGSADNSQTYCRVYRLDDETPYRPSSQHSVRVFSIAGEELGSCLLAATGGATGIHEHSAVAVGDILFVAVGPYTASLQLPSLDLLWSRQVDGATCFGLHHAPAHCCLIAHGELAISRLGYDGAVAWTACGADIFTGQLEVAGDRVRAEDFDGRTYLWDIRTGEHVE